jgi:hypothetical protein
MNRPAPTTLGATLRALPATLLLLLLAILSGSCGDDTSSIFEGERTFWATDFTIDNTYPVRARPLAVGNHCYVYVEAGADVDAATARAVASWFDDNVYLQLRGAFGEEPNPTGSVVIDNTPATFRSVFVGDADLDPKVYLLLLDIRDGFRPEVGAYTLGYFDGWNETEGAFGMPSNRKEILFLDINPGDARLRPDGSLPEEFRRTIAHEFQHMIHWEQKVHRPLALASLARNDDTWLNEAMSMVAPGYTGLGVDRAHVAIYERFSPDSLVDWGGLSIDYATAYAWGEFLREHCGDDCYYDSGTISGRLSSANVFRSILGNDRVENEFTGIQSVNKAFHSAADNVFVFRLLFRNWSMASFYGNGTGAVAPPAAPLVLPDNTVVTGPNLAYTLFDTWRTMPAGTWDIPTGTLEILGLLNGYAPLNRATLPSLGPWAFSVNRFETAVAPGTIRWIPVDKTHTATLIRQDGTVVPFLPDNVAVSYDGRAWIIDRNDQSSVTIPSDNTASFAAGSRSPLSAASSDPGVALVRESTGRPYGVCVQSWLAERYRRLAFPTP